MNPSASNPGIEFWDIVDDSCGIVARSLRLTVRTFCYILALSLRYSVNFMAS